MGVLHGLLVVGAIGLIAVAPCLVCLLLISADEILERTWRFVRRRLLPRRKQRSALGGRWTETRLGRRWQLSRLGRGVQEFAAGERPAPSCPPIEQVAGDLRRLNRLRGGIALRSPVWFNAVQRAYDEGLRTACRQLGVEEHLDELHGVDLDLERLRLEGELQRAGLVLRDAGAQQR
ncbi:hypothetical protein KZZ52_57695 [Dactylosporangium sp. AC04546]|uniref:hypothetical protein n=1 Tax=Dactylosporangium sp. AC04546 TaxID=2862460 RepID=UPI001EDD085B|nr:hypothetical protein [Dactylosporangium sp. AC04546]WVK83443.1 hypothetical protein KZZ52_57695 [Dactylosporangium sp. AC04546]